MVAANNTTYIETGSNISYKNPVFVLDGADFSQDGETVGLRYRLYPNPFTAASSPFFQFTHIITRTEIDAFTASGSGDCDQFENVCDQALEDYLSGISENSSVTFTIS